MKENLHNNIEGNEGKVPERKPASQFGGSHFSFQGEDAGYYSFQINKELSTRIKLLCQKYKESSFSVLLSAVRSLLCRYNTTGNIRANNATEQSICSSLILPVEVSGDTPFSILWTQVATAIHTAHGSSPSTADESDVVCKVAFSFIYQAEMDAVKSKDFQPGVSLEFVAAETNILELLVKYNNKMYAPAFVERMSVHLDLLLASIVDAPEETLGALPMLTDRERYDLINVFNNTNAPYEANSTIVELFERRVANSPDSPALYMDEEVMTYAELNGKANRLARLLIREGVSKEDNVGLLMHRGFDMIVGMYAILKVGAAYVPITPDLPAERLLHIVQQSSVRYILANFEEALPPNIPRVKAIDMGKTDYTRYPGDNLCVPIDSKQLAYTIYTSGSTGLPKGVMIEHHSVVNLIAWVNTQFDVDENDRLLFVTSMGFDLSVYDIFGIHAAGGALVIVKKEDVPNVDYISEVIERFNITFWDSVPSTMDYLVNRLQRNNDYVQSSLRLVFLSGDWIPVPLPAKIRNIFPNAKVISLGGATEATVWSNFYQVESSTKGMRSIPYGRPITNNSFYILNDQLQPVPNGIIGELYIGGVGVARGYANDPEKTSKSFLADPFTSQWGGRMYKTGDLGRMMPDGVMEFVGRKDSQVKVRGHRVELGEIESVIRQSASVNNAVVLLSEDKTQLISYVVPGKYYDRDLIIGYVKKKLPDYMIPGKWMEIESMPLTPNGKIDAKALLKMGKQEHAKRSTVSPQTELERSLTAIWKSCLQVDEVGMTDNFFDLGGQSLVAVEVVNEMAKTIGRKLPLNILYKCPTLQTLIIYLEKETSKSKWKSLVPVKPTGTKMPVYIVHGDGLSLSVFENLANYVDPEQPVFGLLPIGLNDNEDPLENISEIASVYVSEMVDHNPDGPYALGGYSFGGYIAIEMRKQLEGMGKCVKMLAIFDTNAENAFYKTDRKGTLSRRILRQFPKLIFITRSLLARPITTLKYQYTLFHKRFNEFCYRNGLKPEQDLKGVDRNIKRVDECHLRAFRKYRLEPFDDKLYLFKAKSRIYFVDDFRFLGWGSYAKKGVKVYNVPGNHSSMFHQPHVGELARSLQHALDNC